MQGVGYVMRSVQIMLSRLDDQRSDMLKETEKMIIIPGLRQVMQCCNKLAERLTQLQIHKSTREDER